ncbi:MAG: hypothetical protein DI629_17780 [Mesorhizobium amorphae]|nr:MAG: hypothetical protein DI629_17780 [Mesorhizobium amorphae]
MEFTRTHITWRHIDRDEKAGAHDIKRVFSNLAAVERFAWSSLSFILPLDLPFDALANFDFGALKTEVAKHIRDTALGDTPLVFALEPMLSSPPKEAGRLDERAVWGVKVRAVMRVPRSDAAMRRAIKKGLWSWIEFGRSIRCCVLPNPRSVAPWMGSAFLWSRHGGQTLASQSGVVGLQSEVMRVRRQRTPADFLYDDDLARIKRDYQAPAFRVAPSALKSLVVGPVRSDQPLPWKCQSSASRIIPAMLENLTALEQEAWRVCEFDVPRALLGMDPFAWDVRGTKSAILWELERAGVAEQVVAFALVPFYVDARHDGPRALEWGVRVRAVVRLAPGDEKSFAGFANWVEAWTTPTQCGVLITLREADEFHTWFEESFSWPVPTPLVQNNPDALSPRVTQLRVLQKRWTKDDFTFVAGAQPGQFVSALEAGLQSQQAVAKLHLSPASPTRH